MKLSFQAVSPSWVCRQRFSSKIGNGCGTLLTLQARWRLGCRLEGSGAARIAITVRPARSLSPARSGLAVSLPKGLEIFVPGAAAGRNPALDQAFAAAKGSDCTSIRVSDADPVKQSQTGAKVIEITKQFLQFRQPPYVLLHWLAGKQVTKELGGVPQLLDANAQSVQRGWVELRNSPAKLLHLLVASGQYLSSKVRYRAFKFLMKVLRTGRKLMQPLTEVQPDRGVAGRPESTPQCLICVRPGRIDPHVHGPDGFARGPVGR